MKRIKVDCSTYLFILLAFFSGFIIEAIIIIGIVLFHELGHSLWANITNHEVISITLYPFGGITQISKPLNSHNLSDLITYLGGIINQLVLAIVVMFINNLHIIPRYYYLLFIKYNSAIMLFNLIPMIPLDGYLIFNYFFNNWLCYKKSYYLSYYLSIFMLLLFFISNYVYSYNNYLILGFLLYKLYEYIKNEKSIYNRFLLERHLYDFRYKKQLRKYNNTLDNLCVNKEHYIFIDNTWVSEKQVLAKKFDKPRYYW